MTIRKTTLSDLTQVMAIYTGAQARMEAAGNPQWPRGWPSEERVHADIDAGESYVMEDGGDMVAVFMLQLGDEPTYAVIEDGAWLDDEPYGTLHRIASNGTARGVLQAALEYCESVSPNMRVDTHETNLPMQHALEKLGYVRCGIVHMADGSPRIAYQKQKADS